MFYLFGVFSYFLYFGLSIKSGAFFKKNTEQDNLQYAIGTSKSLRCDYMLMSVLQREIVSGT